MEVTINIDLLRSDLKDHFLGLSFQINAYIINYSDIDFLSPEDLVKVAINEGFDLNKYIISRTK